MKEFWNDRFSKSEYAYGMAPNAYFAEKLNSLKPGRILLPAEGEGRNAHYALSLGWEVTAYDYSEEARKKALKLCGDQSNRFIYLISEHESLNFEPEYFDAIGLVYAHTNNWEKKYVDMLPFLKKNGHLILEAFSENQPKYSSSGPKEKSWLLTEMGLRQAFSTLKIHELHEKIIHLNEGAFHQGESSVIRCFAGKPGNSAA